MANHQHALVRYVTLDRCLSKRRLTKEELIDRCSEAVNRVTGDERRLSEKTFFNDIRAMREGIVLGREALIRCDQGLYQYEVHGFSLFHAGEEKREFEAIRQELTRMQNRARLAWERIEASGIDRKTADSIRVLLLSDNIHPWVHSIEQSQRKRAAEERRTDSPRVRESLTDVNNDLSTQVAEQRKSDSDIRFSIRRQFPVPPGGLSPEQLAQWYLLNEYSWSHRSKQGRFAKWREWLFGRRLLSVLRGMGLR